MRVGLRHRLGLWLLVSYGLCGCHSHVETARSAEVSVAVEQEHQREEGPSIQVVEEFGPSSPNGPDTPQGGFTDSAGSQDSLREPLTAARPPDVQRVANHGPLIKRTTTITGPIHESWMSEAIGHGAEQQTDIKDVRPSASCAFGGGLWVALVVAAIAGLAYFRREAIVGILKRLLP